MNNTSQEIQHVVHQQMESLDDTDALSSVWKDSLSSATEATSFRQQALLWYVILSVLYINIKDVLILSTLIFNRYIQ